MRQARFAQLSTTVLVGIFALLALALYVVDLGGGSIWNTDDALYGHVVHRMLAEGRWLPVSWFDYDVAGAYPFGVCYLAAIARLAGGSLLGLRLPALFAAVACVGALVAMRTDRRGRAAALFLVVQPMFFMLSQRVLHDMLLAALTALALAAYHRGKDSLGAAALIAAGLFTGLASLTKMWAGLLPLAVMGLDVLLFERRLFRRAALWMGLVLAVAIPVLGFGLAGNLGILGGAITQRIAVNLAGAAPGKIGGPAINVLGSTTLRTIVAQGVPGIALLLVAAIGALVSLRRRDALDRLVLLWALVAMCAVGAMQTYLSHYALVVIVPMSLLAGGAIVAGTQRWLLLQPLSVMLAIAGLSWPADEAHYAHHADDTVAVLARRQRDLPAETFLCTIDFYHAASVFYAERSVAYLTEDEASRLVLHRVFGEATVPTLLTGGIAARLRTVPSYACIVLRGQLGRISPLLPAGAAIVEPPPATFGPDVVLVGSGGVIRP